eukprot:Transcript_30406.p1 GENE.Transcript_30406~~Transcript_30406.p1  ORF type:complete len:423 (-),score=197.27 Transcript_30406:981-2249(-)
MSSLTLVIKEFSKLGLIAFGGPPAHVALMLKTFAEPGSLEWISESAFASLFALTQCLPGPSSTQLATALGGLQAGLPGALAAFVCFDLPGFIVLATSGVTLNMYKDVQLSEEVMDLLVKMQLGLGAASVGLLCHAALTIVKKCAPDKMTKGLALLSAVAATLINSAALFPVLLTIGGVTTRLMLKVEPKKSTSAKPADSEAGGDKASLLSKAEAEARKGLPRPLGVLLFAAWAVLFPLLWLWSDQEAAPEFVKLACAFFRTGSLVWGGGQVVLPMLLRELVPTWLTEADFVRGFGLVQAMPGPVFNLSAFLGGVAMGVPGALLAWASLFGPGLLLILAALPFWQEIQANAGMATALKGVNASASGLVVAAALLLAKSYAATLEQQVLAMVCFAAITFFGVHQALTIVLGAVLAVPLYFVMPA